MPMVENAEKPNRRPFFQHRDLLVRFTMRQIERQTKGSWLGMLWVLVNPLLMLGLFSVVFGAIMGGDFGVKENAGIFDYPLGIFIGLTVMGLITETMGQSPFAVMSAPNLVQKVVFPLHLLPVALVGSILFRTLMSCLLVFVALAFLEPGLSWSALWFPLILAPMVLLALGLAWLLAALGVFFRDSQQLMGFLGSALFYSSAVFYSSHRIPEAIYVWLKFNPVLQAIELSRDVLLWDIPLDPLILVYLWGVGAVVCGIGLLVFQKLRSGFADVM